MCSVRPKNSRNCPLLPLITARALQTKRVHVLRARRERERERDIYMEGVSRVRERGREREREQHGEVAPGNPETHNKDKNVAEG